AIQVDWHDCSDRPMAPPADELPCLVSYTPVFEEGPQHLRGHVVGAFFNIDELWKGPGLRNSLSCGNKRVRDCDNHIASSHSACHQCKPQRICTATHCDGLTGLAECGECLFEFFHHRAADEIGSKQCAAKYMRELLLELDMRSDQIKEGDAVIHR